MKIPVLALLMCSQISIVVADERLAWLRDRPVKKARVVSSSKDLDGENLVEKAAWTVSSKDSRQRTVTISNKPKSTGNAGSEAQKVQGEPIPVSLEPIQKKSERAGDASEVKSVEEQSNYIASLESELVELNNEVLSTDDDSVSDQIKTRAESALKSSSKETLRMEFIKAGAMMSDAQADAYLKRLLETLKAQRSQ